MSLFVPTYLNGYFKVYTWPVLRFNSNSVFTAAIQNCGPLKHSMDFCGPRVNIFSKCDSLRHYLSLRPLFYDKGVILLSFINCAFSQFFFVTNI